MDFFIFHSLKFEGENSFALPRSAVKHFMLSG